MAERWQIGVCSWSLLVRSIPELERLLDDLDISWTHLALGDPYHASWVESDDVFTKSVKKASFKVSAAMLGFPGEDYTTPATIRRTGGFGDPALREDRLKLLSWGAKKTKGLGLSVMSCHAGFIPEKGDPDRGPFLDCLRRALDIAAAEGVTLAFETGQETATLLRATLDELKRPNAKVNFDPANMLLYNKGDPIEAVRILGKDIVHVHVKDANAPTKPDVWGDEVPLGQGQVSMERFLAVLKEVGYRGPLAIEREVGDQAGRIKDIRGGAELLKRLAAAR